MEEAMRKKLVSAFLAAALTVSALTGCSSQTGADAKGESTAAEQKTEAEESKAGETAAEEGSLHCPFAVYNTPCRSRL